MPDRSPAESGAGPSGSEEALRSLQERFVLHWSEMAAAWGINRTMGQIHALLFVSEQPLTTDDLIDRLRISRGNASMNLRSLEDWGLIERVHFTGDRRDYFRSLTDVWEITRAIARERKRRELDPSVRALSRFVAEAQSRRRESDTPGLAAYEARLSAMLALFRLLDSAWERLAPLDRSGLTPALEIEIEGLP